MSIDIVHNCPECGKVVTGRSCDIYDGEEFDLECSCGCYFYVIAEIDFGFARVIEHGRIGQEKIGEIEAEKYLDKATPSLFPGVPPLRDLLREQRCQANP